MVDQLFIDFFNNSFNNCSLTFSMSLFRDQTQFSYFQAINVSGSSCQIHAVIPSKRPNAYRQYLYVMAK